jgi:hypothetical protein
LVLHLYQFSIALSLAAPRAPLRCTLRATLSHWEHLSGPQFSSLNIGQGDRESEQVMHVKSPAEPPQARMQDGIHTPLHRAKNPRPIELAAGYLRLA